MNDTSFMTSIITNIAMIYNYLCYEIATSITVITSSILITVMTNKATSITFILPTLLPAYCHEKQHCYQYHCMTTYIATSITAMITTSIIAITTNIATMTTTNICIRIRTTIVTQTIIAVILWISCTSGATL